jgi:hypothetical protein
MESAAFTAIRCQLLSDLSAGPGLPVGFLNPLVCSSLCPSNLFSGGHSGQFYPMLEVKMAKIAWVVSHIRGNFV